eukprot:TRINITY_DN5334_c0_g2_i1.p1 TRINITY_DN5334_c0_g2~~TRINITY_DN5334_c0_g2_i1.p1  ORF type:complete len:268 (+),score=37.30 TRINITY_DN5334_c0_g2_i1:49-852(+)
MEALISFASGAMYGLTSVIVGQPLDTVKTTMQALPTHSKRSILGTASDIVKEGGPLGLWRGGIPPVLGGAFFRSCQFGAYNNSLRLLRDSNLPQTRIFMIDYQVVIAGMCGGFGRGLAEGPFDYVKVRQQVKGSWSFREAYKGTAITMTRNIFLFAIFAFNIDMSKQFTNGEGFSPFMTGAICANGAWLAIWPLDVIKSRAQSGLHEGKSAMQHLMEASRTRALYRGLLPGLARSTLANGSAMVVYKKTTQLLEDLAGIEKKDASAI